MNTSPLVRGSGGVGATPHTEVELSALLGILAGPRIHAVTIGHGRDPASRAAAAAFEVAWVEAGGEVLATVDWPEEAASWLRAARRFAAGEPDAWVVAGAPLGWAQLSRRLRHSTDWDPGRTFGFASLGTTESVRLAGIGTLDGLRGVSADGGDWRIGRSSIAYSTPRS
jgi:Periplasmic binding protein